MVNKQKVKGKGFELDVAKFLSKTYDDSFIRVPNSGAYVGGKNAFRKETLDSSQIQLSKGDIIPPEAWTSFNCECKFYKDISFTALFANKYALLDGWIDEVRQAQEPNDFNIILIRINYKGQWVLYEEKHPFVVQNKLDYKEWMFCSWDKFWTPDNTKLVKKLSSN